MKILIVQTAFIGDVILTLPLIQTAKQHFDACTVDIVVIPNAVNLLNNHPDISEVIIFDKRKKHSGIYGFVERVKYLREKQYDIAIVPHRSLRSALLTRLSKIPIRIGFMTSAASFLFTSIVSYAKDIHEIERNLKLLEPFGFHYKEKIFPALFPSTNDIECINQFFKKKKFGTSENIITVAPGSVWKTKRWRVEGYIELCKTLIERNYKVIIIGGEEDKLICNAIESAISDDAIVNSAGIFSLLQSAEIIRRSKALITNDSSPLHLAVAMKTPVVAIFGPTIPAFGFFPYGNNDKIVEVKNLHCRPCSIHGGEKCPVKTFDCMNEISAAMVFQALQETLKEIK